MKIGVMTWLYNGNYGSILQAYSLQKMLRLRGYDVKLINYKPTIKTKLINLIVSRNSLTLFYEKYELSKLKRKTKGTKDLDIKEQRFSEFINEGAILTKEFYKPKDLFELNDMLDIFICGSDQIWSPRLFNKTYYLDYVNNDKKLISYAPSFGVSTITGKKREKITKLLRRFNHISVREDKGAEIVKELINKEVPVVLDPTLLIESKDWDTVAVNPQINEPYIFCYFLADKPFYWESVEKLRKITGYKVVIIPAVAETFEQKYTKVTSAGPKEFVGLIRNAAIVCTDSFHGTIFSINYKTDFYVFKRFEDTAVKSQNSRVYNILNMLNLKNRLVEENKKFTKEDINVPNYNEVHKLLGLEREKSINWIIDAIESKN